jgi:2,3-bisphosphoglycerate-independent phosphoglycerate mutase
MKYCIVVPDGAADFPVGRLDGRTPLEAARTPNVDRAAREGMLGTVRHVPPRMTPGSSVAMMSVIGYDPARFFTGRGPIEAAGLGCELRPAEWAVRCNLITASDNALADFTAGHVSTEEARLLLDALNEHLGSDTIRFHPGVSYRHVMVYSGDEPLGAQTVPPHDIVGEPMPDHYPQGQGDLLLIGLMERSRPLLEGHEVNQVRVDLGKNPANMVWLWSPGKRPAMEPFVDRFGTRGAVICAVNLVRGMARLVGWELVHVPGATGYTDTDYAAKGRYAIDALREHDLVLVHVEAPDEASHECDVAAKVRAIEQIDDEIVGPLMAHAADEEGLRLLVVPDHVTAVQDGKHKRDPVPFAIWGAGVRMASGVPFTEGHAGATEVVFDQGHRLIEELLRR